MPETQETDVLVVGAGAVGIPLAIRLVRAGLRVTLIDGGPAQPDGQWQERNRGPQPLAPYRGLIEGRMKVVGGTTRLWGGQLAQFERGDLERKDADGRRLWPISWEDYLAALSSAYDILGIGAEERDLDGLYRSRAGAPRDFAPGLTARVIEWLRTPDFTQAFAGELRRIDLRPGHRVRRILSAGATPRAEIETPDGTWSIEARHIVLAAGSIENAGLLLRSAACDPALPFAANRHLGAHYFDHLHGLVGSLRPHDPKRIGALFDGIWAHGRKLGVKIGTTTPDPSRPSMVATLNATTPGALLQDIRGLGRRLGPASHAGLALIPAAWRYMRHRRIANVFGDSIPLGIETEQFASSERRVVIDSDRPPLEARAGVAWSVDPKLTTQIAEFAEEIGRGFTAADLGEVILDPAFASRDPAALSQFHDASHHMGGTRMASNAVDGVVDPFGRVFGCDSLHIAGASVFPSGSFANPTLSAIALGLRTADRIIAGDRT